MAAFKRRAASTEVIGDGLEMPSNEATAAFQANGTRTTQYMQYVKALNSQFSSWVQQQLKEHPHQLWQEGVQDYLRHASKIQEDFKDVLSSNESNDKGVVSPFQATTSLFNSIDQTNSAIGKPNALFGQPFSLPNPFMATTMSALPVLNIPTTPANNATNNGDDLQDEDDVPPQPSSPSVKRSEEPGVVVIHEVKCKLYVKAEPNLEKNWKEMGMGNLTLKSKEGAEKGSKDSKVTILVRNEVGRLLLNALLYPNIKMNVQKNTVTGIFHSAETDIKTQVGDNQENDAGKGRLYLFKLKTANDAEKLLEAITSNAPKAE